MKDREYFCNEEQLRIYCQDILERRGYVLFHLAKKTGRKHKNNGVGLLDVEAKKENVLFLIEFKNPIKKPHQWTFSGAQLEEMCRLRKAKISHAVIGSIHGFRHFVGEAEKGKFYVFYDGLKII